MNATAPPRSGDEQWTVLRGPVTSEQILRASSEVARRYGLAAEPFGGYAVQLTDPARSAPVVTVRWRPLPPQPPHTVGYQLPAPPAVEILIDPGPGHAPEPARELRELLATAALPYTTGELDGIAASMPLVRRYSRPDPAFEDWALIFRDHYLEHSVGFLLGMERAGIPARWIHALDKGDRTHNRDRVHAAFLARGYRSDLLDNAAVNDPATHAADLARVTAGIDAFIDEAHAAGRRVLVIDDGGLLARGYGAARAKRRVDAAIELTVSGVKRIADAGPLGIPVLNMARSQTKTLLGYPEIADSCMRRLRTILPDRKLIGRRVLLIGYGTLGSRLAPALRGLGCRVDVVDTDLAALITAAEAGYPTHRTAAEALRATDPFLVIGTTGETALTAQDLALLPDGVHLAPFATRDFSILSEDAYAPHTTEIPSVGRRFRLGSGRTAVLLGDGRSLNLFEADSIPNQGYDAYRAGTLIAAKHLCTDPDRIPRGLHQEPADEAITAAGLFEAYYDLYLAHPAAQPPARATAVRERVAVNACVVGYGVAGRLHTEILTELGATVTLIDPKHQDLPKTHRSFPHEVGQLPAALAAGIDLWSLCCPTVEHLSVLRAVLAHNPAARILLEKPACQGHELDAFRDLLVHHPRARVVVNDQYRHSVALPAFAGLIRSLEPAAPISRATITFTKDRTADIASGRFIDRAYGVLGYEWLHMLAVLARLLPDPVLDTYLAGDPSASELWATYDPRLFVAALTERTSIDRDDDGRIHLELASSILGPSILLGATPDHRPPWRQGIRPADDRHRHVTVHAGTTRFTLHLDPVTAPDGWQLDRNHHRLTAERDGRLLHDGVLQDSPLAIAVRHALSVLMDEAPLPTPDLTPLRRIASLAEFLRARAPHHAQTSATAQVPE